MVRDEYAEFIWEEEKYKCHVDEFVDRTRASLLEAGNSDRMPALSNAASWTRLAEQYKNCYFSMNNSFWRSLLVI